MDLTIFTFISTIFWVSMFACAISLLRKHMSFFNYFSLSPLLIILLFCILRLLLPIEWPFTIIFNSKRILPFIQNFLNYSLFDIGNMKFTLFSIFLIVWISRSIYLFFKNLIANFRFRHLLNLLPSTNNQRIYDCFFETMPHGSLASAKIIVHNSIQSPAIFGIFRPVILIPDIEFSDNELIGIFIHESAHYQYGHCIIKYIAELIQMCFWWNPCFKKMSSEIAHALELHSDRAVSKIFTFEQKKEYLTCIAKIVCNISDASSSLTCNLIESKNAKNLKQRIKLLLDNSYCSKKKSDLLIIPILIAMFVLSYSIVPQPYNLPSENEVGVHSTINSDSYLVKTSQGYNLYTSENEFIAHIKYIDESLSSLKIYENKEDVK